ncbi:rootletin-like [Pongo abelii]|uniref:rootletin-like n=1 Tax=Pongo abelii TaxID=9601 RepID=UPI0023E8B771|nr:rootletin-like [Pongo abelii]
MAVLRIVPASPRLEQTLWLESGELETQEPRRLVRQSVELRRQLQEEQASYRRKLQAYQEGQQRQAQLVQQLQGKFKATHSCSFPPTCSHCPAPSPGAHNQLPIPRFSITRRGSRS